MLGELNRLRDPKTDDRDDPSNLLDNTSGGKQILNRFKAAGSSRDRRLLLLGNGKKGGERMELDEIGVSRAILERFARMGPVFGGLLLSGEKVARLLLDRLGSRR